MINDDYFDKKRCDPKIPERFCQDPVEWLCNRYDVAAVKTGQFPSRFFNLKLKHGEAKYKEFKKEFHDLCATILKEKYENIPKSLEGKTIVFEFARGGPEGASFPLKPPFGYEYSLALFDKEILENAAILYIWVTPEMSYNMNLQRAKEGQEGKSQTLSTQLSLNHGVPHNVMKGDTERMTLITFWVCLQRRVISLLKRTERNSILDVGDSTKEQIKKMEDGMKAAFDALLGEH